MLHHPDLPPLDLLPTFELSARLGSFKEAARALHLSPSAVSQQIKALEDALGVALFVREVRSIRLSPEGQRFLDAVRPALTSLAAAAAALRRRPLHGPLRVTTVPFVAHELLIPNLYTFAEAGGRALAVETAMGLQDERLFRGEIDAAIRMGLGRWPHLSALKVGDIEASPVCAASMAPRLRTPGDLARLPLIAVRGHEARTWRPLADREGFAWPPDELLVFESYFETLRAAESGLGVSLGLFPLVKTWIDRGRLVAPFPWRWPSPASLYLVVRPEDEDDPVIAALKRWLVALYAELGPVGEAPA